MNKFNLIISFCLIFVLFASCAPDLTDDVEWAYYVAKNNSSGSCTTMEDGNMWSPMTSSTMDWDSAVSYCNNLTACGYSDWHLPTISELRTLIQNCSETVTGGSCEVTDECLALSSSSCFDWDVCQGCDSDFSGKYSKLGDTCDFWSSSTYVGNTYYAWYVNFNDGYVFNYLKTNSYYVRCVR